MYSSDSTIHVFAAAVMPCGAMHVHVLQQRVHESRYATRISIYHACLLGAQSAVSQEAAGTACL